MITAILAAAASEPNAGWGKLSALIITGGAFYVGTNIYKRVKGIEEGPSKALPTAKTARTLNGVKAQVSIGSDPTSDPSQKGSPAGDGDLDELVRSQVGARRPSQIIRTARARLGVSESTVKRAIRRARATS